MPKSDTDRLEFENLWNKAQETGLPIPSATVDDPFEPMKFNLDPAVELDKNNLIMYPNMNAERVRPMSKMWLNADGSIGRVAYSDEEVEALAAEREKVARARPRIESEPIGASGLGEVSERNRDVHLVDGRSTGPFDRTKVDIAQTNTSSSPGALSSYAIDNKPPHGFLPRPVTIARPGQAGNVMRENQDARSPIRDITDSGDSINPRTDSANFLKPTDRAVNAREMFDALDFSFEGDKHWGVAFEDPMAAIRGRHLAHESRDDTWSEYPESRDRYHDEADAFRHALWSYRLTKALGKEKAKWITDSHERAEPDGTDESLRDLFNNYVGRVLASDPANAGKSDIEVIRAAIKDGLLQLRPFNTGVW